MDSPSSDTELRKRIPLVQLLSFSAQLLSPFDKSIREGSFDQSKRSRFGQPPITDVLILNAIRDLTQHRERAGLPKDTTVYNYIGIMARKRGSPLTVIEEAFQKMLEMVGSEYSMGSNGTVSPAAAAHTSGRKRTNQSKNISQMKKKIRSRRRNSRWAV